MICSTLASVASARPTVAEQITSSLVPANSIEGQAAYTGPNDCPASTASQKLLLFDDDVMQTIRLDLSGHGMNDSALHV